MKRTKRAAGGPTRRQALHPLFAPRCRLGKSDTRYRGFWNLLPVAGLILLASSLPCLGQDVVSVTPTHVSLSLAPGEAASVKVSVINQGSNRLLLQPSVLEVLSGEGDSTVLKRSERCLWVEPESDELSLEPNSRGDFSFRVQPPPASPTGGYRFALAFIPKQEKPGGIAFTGGLAVLLELEVLPPPPAPGGPIFPYVLLATCSALVLATAILVIWRIKRRAKGTVG